MADEIIEELPVNPGVTGVAAIIVNEIAKRESKNLEDLATKVQLLSGAPNRAPLKAIEDDREHPEPARGNGGIVSRGQPTDPLYRNLLRGQPEYRGARDPDQDHWNVAWLCALRDNDRVAMKVAAAEGDKAFKRANLLEGTLNVTSPTAVALGSGASLLPQSYANVVEIGRGAASVLPPLCTNFTATGGTLRVPTMAAVTAVTASEGAAPAEANPTVASVMMILTKLGARIILSDELLADSPFNVMDLAGRRVGEGIGVLVDTQILTSDGNTPNITGPLVGGAITEATSSELNYEDPAKLFFSLGKAYQNNGTWLAGTLLAQLLSQLTDGTGVQALKPTPGPSAAVTDLPLTNAIGAIFGRPVYHVPAAVAGDLIFGDLRSFGWATRGGIEAKVSTEVGFASDTTQFKFTLRADGQMLDTAGIKEFQGITALG